MDGGKIEAARQLAEGRRAIIRCAREFGYLAERTKAAVDACARLQEACNALRAENEAPCPDCTGLVAVRGCATCNGGGVLIRCGKCAGDGQPHGDDVGTNEECSRCHGNGFMGENGKPVRL